MIHQSPIAPATTVPIRLSRDPLTTTAMTQKPPSWTTTTMETLAPSSSPLSKPRTVRSWMSVSVWCQVNDRFLAKHGLNHWIDHLLCVYSCSFPIQQICILSCADAMNHQNSAYKFKSTNGVVPGNNHIAGGVTGGGSYRQQRSGPHPLQQQPLNLSQVQWEGSTIGNLLYLL